MKSKKAFMLLITVTISVFALTGLSPVPVHAQAKSLYVNRDLNANSPIRAYGIVPAPGYLTFQQDSVPTRYGGSGIAIDTDSEILFITFEGSGILDIVDARTLGLLGQVTAPNARNLAGIVVDEDNQKVYTIDRTTNNLYVYTWDSTALTLTNDIVVAPFYVDLVGVFQGHGIALDEVNDLLYVGDLTDTVKIFNTADWSPAGSFVVSQRVQGIAIDVDDGLVYTGNAYPFGTYAGLGLLSQYNLATNTEAVFDIRTLPGADAANDMVVGIAVDQATSLVYITTGNQGSGGSDRIVVFDSNLTFLHATGDIGNPTGIVVPGRPISFNPLNLEKDDGLDTVFAGGSITYTISFDNTANNYAVDGVILTDTLPAEVTFVSASDGGVLSGNTVTWNIGTLNPGDTDSVTLVVQVNNGVPDGTIIANWVHLDNDNTGPSFASDDTTVTSPPVGIPMFSNILVLMPVGIFAGTMLIRRRRTNN
jgi:uncharacterized repeat protein (TIGR01451 family)